MFFVGAATGFKASVLSTLLLTATIVLGIFTTLAITKLLSATVLKGVPSSFTLEMPPFRPPQVRKIIVRSILDRTLFVLGRAAAIAAPAGILIWILANTSLGGTTILNHLSSFLNPFAKMIGLDGTILLAFILGFPANEIVIPIIIMIYMSSGTLSDAASLSVIKELFIANGWTPITAICTMTFSLMHWPCSTTLMTIKKETGSIKGSVLAALIPTACGIALCFIINTIAHILI